MSFGDICGDSFLLPLLGGEKQGESSFTRPPELSECGEFNLTGGVYSANLGNGRQKSSLHFSFGTRGSLISLITLSSPRGIITGLECSSLLRRLESFFNSNELVD